MFKWLNDLKIGDKVLIRDTSPGRMGQFPAKEWVEEIAEIDDEYIKTIPVGYKRGSMTIEPLRSFERKYGSDYAEQQLVKKV